MDINVQRISPLWETLSGGEVQPAKDSKTSAFADILQSIVDNVRETEDEAAKNEYLLATGQLDNPAQLSISLYKAEAATQLMVQMRDKLLNVYSELSRISL